MEQLQELIRKYGLEEDLEHVIIPLVSGDGRSRRCFLLKRRFLRIVFPDTHFHDYPLEEIIEATVLYPDMPLRASILLVHKDPDRDADEPDKKNTEQRGEGEEKNTD
ncbi:MAG: hypothetical protein HZB62_03225 [Nitrospirae bacterium]|nr:hypothetical protein [Nitrospirota bacterium]